MRKTFALFSLFTLLLTACGNTNDSYSTIDMEEVKKITEENPEAIVLDVRTVEEYNDGHIPNSLLIPVQELEYRLNELDKDKTYLVICRSGNRSVTASDILLKNGFKHIFNTSGGMNQWTGQIEK